MNAWIPTLTFKEILVDALKGIFVFSLIMLLFVMLFVLA